MLKTYSTHSGRNFICLNANHLNKLFTEVFIYHISENERRNNLSYIIILFPINIIYTVTSANTNSNGLSDLISIFSSIV